MGKALPARTKESTLEDVASEAKEAAGIKRIELRSRVHDSRTSVQSKTKKEDATRSVEGAPADGFERELEDVIQGYLKAEDAGSPSDRQQLE